MIPEIGHFSLVLALSMALVQGFVPLAGAQMGISSWVAVAKPAARMQLLFMLISFFCLTASFLQNDFSVLYVASNSNTALPTLYLISGVWGELLSTAARNAGCVGAVVDGAVRDVRKMRELGFPVFARGTSVYDSQNRQVMIDMDVPVQIGGVRFRPGDLVIADEDGVVVVPQEVEAEVLRRA